MEQRLLQWIKKPFIFQSLYLISSMIIAFGLGVIVHSSISNEKNQPVFQIPERPVPLVLRYKNPTIQNSADYAPAEESVGTVPLSDPLSATATASKNFVASKSGKYYYPDGCSGISRIKDENRVYFETEKEAQEKGYTRTSTCN